MAAIVLLQSMFSPTNTSAVTVLINPEVKTYLVNWCTFYHNRTGVWIDAEDGIDSLNQTLREEFEAKNPAPDLLKEFMK